jgi:hypothetical protein
MTTPIFTFQFIPYITAEYILGKSPLSWREIKWAYKHGMFGRGMLVSLAHQKDDTPLVVELSTLDKDHLWRAEDIILELANNEPEISEDEIVKKWLYIVLSYIYENKELYDPWSKVEEIYADFGYPPELIPIVRYMPKDRSEYNPTEHTQEENLQRFFRLWKEYLDQNGSKYGKENVKTKTGIKNEDKSH